MLAPFFLFTALASGAGYDLIIRNARVLDGAGNPWMRADVAISDGKIAAIGRLDNAVSVISAQRAELGAQQNRITGTINFVQLQNENMTAAESRIRDADMATELIGLTMAQMREQSGLAMLSHANVNQQSVLSLLQ